MAVKILTELMDSGMSSVYQIDLSNAENLPDELYDIISSRLSVEAGREGVVCPFNASFRVSGSYVIIYGCATKDCDDRIYCEIQIEKSKINSIYRPTIYLSNNDPKTDKVIEILGLYRWIVER